MLRDKKGVCCIDLEGAELNSLGSLFSCSRNSSKGIVSLGVDRQQGVVGSDDFGVSLIEC